MDSNPVVKLEVENELQILIDDQTKNVGLELIDGLAEIYGTEMEKNKVYMFPPSTSVAVFTWHGCSIKIIGTPSRTHVTKDTLMMLHVILHACLEEMRIKAESENRKGPVTLIVGPTDAGKSTLCRVLLNYAARLGRRPFLVDLDVGQNALSIPGTINVLNVAKPADIVDGFDQEAIQAYQFGYKSPGQLITLYFLLIKRLGQVLQTRLRQTNNSNAVSSGVIINTGGWTRGQGYNAITLAALSFEIDKLVVLEEERLYTQLKRDMPACVDVLFMPKMGGVVERSRWVRSQSREKRVREYFYGSSTPLQPYSFEIKFSDVMIFKAGMQNMNEEDPTHDVTISDVYYNNVPLGTHLVNQVLALSSSDNVSEEMLLANIIGFICITDIDMNREVISVLSPQPEPLPKKILLMGDIQLINNAV